MWHPAARPCTPRPLRPQLRARWRRLADRRPCAMSGTAPCWQELSARRSLVGAHCMCLSTNEATHPRCSVEGCLDRAGQSLIHGGLVVGHHTEASAPGPHQWARINGQVIFYYVDRVLVRADKCAEVIKRGYLSAIRRYRCFSRAGCSLFEDEPPVHAPDGVVAADRNCDPPHPCANSWPSSCGNVRGTFPAVRRGRLVTLIASSGKPNRSIANALDTRIVAK